MELKNIRVKVGGEEILTGVDLVLNPGEVIALMGPNGSGKSTLAYSLAGHPNYKASGEALIDGEDILKMTADQRTKKGLMLISQYPVEIPGLKVRSFLWQMYKNRSQKLETSNKKKKSLTEFWLWLNKEAEKLELKPELLDRGLNEGFSGGERKKLEVLQMIVFAPQYLVVDEIDSGLDVDALRIIAEAMVKEVKERKMGVLIITHYSRILNYLKPDRVAKFGKGKIEKWGDWKLVEDIETNGY